MIELSRSEPEFILPGGVGMRIVGASVDEGSVSLAMEGDHEMSLRHGCSQISTCIIRRSAFYVYFFTFYLRGGLNAMF